MKRSPTSPSVLLSCTFWPIHSITQQFERKKKTLVPDENQNQSLKKGPDFIIVDGNGAHALSTLLDEFS